MSINLNEEKLKGILLDILSLLEEIEAAQNRQEPVWSPYRDRRYKEIREKIAFLK